MVDRQGGPRGALRLVMTAGAVGGGILVIFSAFLGQTRMVDREGGPRGALRLVTTAGAVGGGILAVSFVFSALLGAFRSWTRANRKKMASEESSSTPHCEKINDSIFELHAPASGRAEMEILFFHGLQLEGTSNPHISTWRSRSAQKEVWPGEWLPKDFPKARILSVSYDGGIKRDATSGRMDMYLVAESLLTNCLLAEVGQLSPVILVGHSFGGLVIKQLCLFAHRRSDRPEVKTFFESVRGIYYIATPHRGSHFASAIEKLSSKEGDLLSHVKVFSKDLARLNSEFSLIPQQWLVSGVGEMLPTKLRSAFNDVVVEEASGRDENFLAVQENHISICQPEARNSTTYQHLSNFIQNVQKFTGESHSYPFSAVRGTYVPIHNQAREHIISALENEQGPPVILLHGDPGSGKSVLARFIRDSYARSCGEAVDSGSMFPSVPHISFKLVIFLECGKTAVSTQLLLKLQEKLHPEVHRSPGQCGNGSTCTLPYLMRGRRIIVILDDVWSPELIGAFLEEIRGCRGADVRILVTSRRSDWFDEPEILKVKSEEVTYTQAEKILASHLGLPSIPQNLQKVAQILVEKSARHPLALAMVAYRITRNRREDPKQWEAVANSYSALLRQQLGDAFGRQGKQGIPFGSVFDCPYKMSIGETLMLTYEDLEPNARYLLLLIAKSEPSSVPSPVVRILFPYGVANHDEYPVPDLRFAFSGLETRGAMLRVSQRVLGPDVPCNSISFGDEQFSYESLGLHDLQKEFLNVLMKEDNKRLEKSLVPDTHYSVPLEDLGKMTSEELERATVWILCILWLRQNLAERAAEKLGVSLPLFGSLSTRILRYKLEPLTWLMHEAFGEEMNRCAKQVMVQFFLYGGVLKAFLEVPDAVPQLVKLLVNNTDDCLLSHVSSMLITLTWPDSDVHVVGTLNKLSRDTIRRDLLLQVCGIVGVIPKLLSLLSSEHPLALHHNALGLLRVLSDHQENRKALLEVPDTVALLVQLLVNSGDDDLLVHAARILRTLSKRNPDVQYEVGGTSGIIPKLLTLLSSEHRPALQRNTSRLLHVLSWHQENTKALLEVPDTVALLVKLLVNSGDDGLLIHVAGILWSLSERNPDVQYEVGRTSGAIRKLLTLLSSEHPPALQYNARGLLHELSDHQENTKALLEVPDTVALLVKLLVNSGDDDLLVDVAGILWSLSDQNPDVQYEIGGTSEAIPKLLTLLSSEHPPVLQYNASGLLYALSIHQENRKALLEVPDTVALLVQLLVNSGDDDLLVSVAGILRTLSYRNPDVQYEVGGTSGAIPKFLTLLSSEHGPALQYMASGLLYALSIHQENRKALLEVPDIVALLVQLLVNSGDDDLLVSVAGILRTLSYRNPDVQYEVGGTSGAIPKLLTLLSSEHRPALQYIASALLRVLSDHQENRKALLEVPDTIALLVQLLVNSGDDDLLVHVARILRTLSKRNPDVQYEVGGTSGAIPKLLTLLSSEHPPVLQYNASLLLHKLSRHQENTKALLEVPDTVALLVQLLVNSGDDDLLVSVAGILRTLSYRNPDVQYEVGGTSGAIPKLLTLLSSEHRPALQYIASALLRVLSDHQENRKALLEVPDTVALLVQLLVNSGDDDLLVHVARILRTLSKRNPDVQYEVGGTSGTIPKLLTLLSSEHPPVLQYNASLLLHKLSRHQENTKALLEVPDTVALLVQLLVNSGDDDLLVSVAGILRTLSYRNPDVQYEVGGTSGAIPKLLTLLSSEHRPALQYIASALLRVLSDHQENRKALLEVPDTVALLVQLLVNSGDDDLLVHVARILRTLSKRNPDVQYEVGGTSGAIPKLLTLLSSEHTPVLQYNASLLLHKLSRHQENTKALLEVPDTVALLVQLLVNSGDDDLLVHAARILRTLSKRNPDVQYEVGGTSGAIPKLLTLLSSEHRPALQRNASRLLHTLSSHQENTKALLEVPDIVALLVKLLVSSGDDDLLINVAGILWSLSKQNPDVQYEVGGTFGAIPKLLTLLSSEHPPQLQSNACCLLFALCKCEDNRNLLSRTLDVVGELVRLSTSSYTVEHLDQLVEILCYLSKGNPSNQSRIGGIPGAISSLLTILFCVDSSSVRLEVSGLLFRLSSFQANRKLFLELPKGLEELVKLFVSSERVELLCNLAGVLNNLLEENLALESQIGGIMSSNPRRRTSRNLYYASRHKHLSLGLRQAMHYEYILFCSRFGFGARAYLFFPGVSGRCDAIR